MEKRTHPRMNRLWKWLIPLVVVAVLLLLFWPRSISCTLQGIVYDGSSSEPCEVVVEGKVIRTELRQREYRGTFRISVDSRTHDGGFVQMLYGTERREYMHYRTGEDEFALGYITAPEGYPWMYIQLTDGREIAVARQGVAELEEIRQAAQELTGRAVLP